MKRAARGMSLIEVLISLVILSIGVLAVVALQLIAKRNNMDAGERTVAAQLAYDMLERMRVNSTPAALSVYVGNATGGVGRGTMGDEPAATCRAGDDNASPTTAQCTQAELARHDVWEWEQALDGAAERIGTSTKVGGLTQPTACIEGSATGESGIYTVTIVWRGKVEIPDRNGPGDTDPDNDVACGAAAEDAGGNRLYGTDDVYRRIVQITAYITARAVSSI